MPPKYRILADELRALITGGTYLPGASLPRISDLADERGIAENTVAEAYKLLESEGLVIAVRGQGTIVKDPPVRIPLSRYAAVLAPGGTRGPWETATHDLGIHGEMRMVGVDEVPAEVDVAEALGVEVGALVHRRRRRAMLRRQVHHLQVAYYALDVAEAVGLTGTETVVGGIYGAMAAAGVTLAMPPREVVTARMPTPGECRELKSGSAVPLLLVERLTRDTAGRIIEVLHVTAPADRLALVYDGFPRTDS